MRTFSIRVDEELYQRLEQARGEINKADYIREVLEENLREPHKNIEEPHENRQEPHENRQEPQENLGEPQENKNEPWENRAQQYESEIAYLRSENTKLLELVAREQALHLTTQQRLLPEPVAVTKPWWKFWKKT